VTVACGGVRVPTGPVERVQLASGVRVTLPHWFRVDFPGPVEDTQDVLRTPNGALPCRKLVAKSTTTVAGILATESRYGFTGSKDKMLADMIMSARAGSTMSTGALVHEGRFDGFDMRLTVAPHAPDNPSDYTIACRVRGFLSDTKMVIGTFCGDAMHPTPEVDATAESLHVLD
jgi:hypothetical protein